MKWKNISILISKIDSFLESKDYFRFLVECAPKKQDITQTESKEDAKLISNITLLQSGCVRTNCMDCLDRTNVVQSVISKRILLKQLRNFDVIKESMIDKSDPFFSFPGSLEKGFREIWTNHANQLSMLYSGTCAQKTDFTLTGKRTTKGAINDGICGVTRYGINNFSDGYYQDCLDMVAGFLKPAELKSKMSSWSKIACIGVLVND